MNFENFPDPKRRAEKLPSQITLDDCELSIRAYQFLKSIGISTLEDLADSSGEELLEKSRNPKLVKEVEQLLQEHNLSFKKDQE